MLAPWKESYDRPRQRIEKQRHHSSNKGLYSQSCGFSSSHGQMWELNHKKGWVLKNWCFWIVVLEKTVERQLDCKVIKLVTPKGNQPWIFIERTDAEAEAPVLLNTLATWCKEQTHWKRPWAWGRWRAGEEAGNRGWDGWMASLTQWTWVCSLLGDGEGQGSLACCSPWGHKELDMTEQLNNSNWFSSLDSGSSAPHCWHKPHHSPCKASSCSAPWPTYHVTN